MSRGVWIEYLLLRKLPCGELTTLCVSTCIPIYQIPPTPVEHDVLEHFGALLRAKAIVPTAAEELRRMETLDTKWMYIFL